ncbi:Cj0814 family flagellar-dependent secreted protein [Campylobacter concisus]|nr:hypothetical protein [Campylobacter concisus]
MKVSAKVATKQTSLEVLGYKVDKDGYFTDEFNKQAGIPSEYKIHSSTLESLVRIETQSDYMQRTFDSIDILKTVNNAYKILSQVVGEDTPTNISITKGGLLAAVINSNLDVKEGETTVFGKKQGFDKSVDSKEFSRAFELFEFMGEMKFGPGFINATDNDIAGMPKYMQDYIRSKRDFVYIDLQSGFVSTPEDRRRGYEEDELSFKKMMERNLKMLKLLFGEIDKDGKKSKDFMDSFLRFSMPPLNLVKELNENPAGKYLVDMLGIKRDVDIKNLGANAPKF